MRLSDKYHEIIVQKAKEIFGELTKIYLFGSRVDDEKRGGDIDLYLIPDVFDDVYNKKIDYLVALDLALGEQKIDVVIAKNSDRLIDVVALRDGVLL